MPSSLFPNRPSHPDFHRISQCLLANDAVAESEGSSFTDVAQRFVDPESLVYAAQQRAARVLIQALIDNDPDIALMCSASWVDGFIAGACFQADGGHVSAN